MRACLGGVWRLWLVVAVWIFCFKGFLWMGEGWTRRCVVEGRESEDVIAWHERSVGRKGHEGEDGIPGTLEKYSL